MQSKLQKTSKQMEQIHRKINVQYSQNTFTIPHVDSLSTHPNHLPIQDWNPNQLYQLLHPYYLTLPIECSLDTPIC